MTATAMHLYEVGDTLEQIADQLVENGGELTPELEAMLDAMTEAFDAKAESIALVIRSAESRAAGIHVEAERLAKLERAHENTAKRLKAYLLREMERAGKRKMQGKLVSVSVCANSRPSITLVGPVEQLPASLTRYVPARVEFDSQAAYEAWKVRASEPDGPFAQAERAVLIVADIGSHVRVR